MEPTTSDATSSLLSQLDANLARLDAAAIRLQEQRTALVIQAVAARIMRSHADATSFTIRPRTEPRGWEFDSAAAENGAALRLDEVLIADIDATLRDRLPLSGSTMLTPETQPSEAPHRPRFPIPPNEHDPMVTPASVLDIDTLTEDEFTQIYRTAQDRLDLVGIVRTRGDFDAQLRDLQLRADVTDNEIGVAVDVALLRYRQVVEESPRIADIEAETFHQVIGEVARFLDLEQDDYEPGPATGYTIISRRDSGMEH